MNLKEPNSQHYKDKYGNIGRMIVFLKPKAIAQTTMQLKQADVLMIYYFLSPDSLTYLELMGYHIGDELSL